MTDNNLQQETILAVGVEGGAIEIKGHKRPSGAWEFDLHTSNIWFDDPDIGGSAPKTYGSVDTWEAAINLLSQLEKRWIWLYAADIHPEFTSLVKSALEQQLSLLRKDELQHWMRSRSRDWSRALNLNHHSAFKTPFDEITFPTEDRSIQDICMVKYTFSFTGSGDSESSIDLFLQNQSEFEYIRTLWQAFDSSITTNKSRIQEVLQAFERENWGVIEKQEGKSSGETGGELWQSYTLKKGAGKSASLFKLLS